MRMLNRIIGGSIAAAAVIALSALTAQARPNPNLLINPGFEDAGGFTANPIHLSGENQGWATFGASQTNMFNSADFPHSGSYALLAVNNPGNNWNPQGAYQILSGITPSYTYTLSAWFLTDTGTKYGTPVDLQLGFGNWAGTNWNALGTVENGPGNNINWGFGPAPAGSIPANDTWYQGSVSGTAPAGSTDAIVYLFFMDGGQTATEDVYFDDTTLVVPEPSSLALLALAVPFFFIRRRKS